MRVIVSEIYGNEVLVTTEFGNVRGKWCSNNPPKCKEYILELDCSDILSAQNCQLTDCETPLLGMEKGRVHVCGLCESCEDRVLFLRLGKYLIMLECACNLDVSSFIGRYIHVVLSSLKLYDTGVL